VYNVLFTVHFLQNSNAAKNYYGINQKYIFNTLLLDYLNELLFVDINVVIRVDLSQRKAWQIKGGYLILAIYLYI